MLELITQRIKASKFGLPGLGDHVADLLKSPSTPFRSEDDVEVVLKFHAEEKADTAKLSPGQVRHYITTAALDRDHEIMMPKGLDSKWYKKNPVVLWSHDYAAVDNIIGSNVSLEHTDRGVRALTQFAMRQPQAVQVFDLFKEGHLRAWSVGFISLAGKEPTAKDLDKLTIMLGERPKEGEVRYIHEKWSLLEYSAVAVPSNMEALTEAVAKGLKLDDVLLKQLEITVAKAVDGGQLGDKNTKVVFDLGALGDGDGKTKKGAPKAPEEEEPEDGATEGKYKCECIECGHKMTSAKHCNELKCPECGGEMRRQERPGPGKEAGADDCGCSYMDDGVEYRAHIPDAADVEVGEAYAMKPFPQEHACRLADPAQFDRFTRGTRESGGKTYSIIFGWKDNTSTEQAYRYKKTTWTAAEAGAHCKAHKGKFEAASEAAGYFYADAPLTDEQRIAHTNAFSNFYQVGEPIDSGLREFATTHSLTYVPWEDDQGTVPKWLDWDDDSDTNYWTWKDGYTVYWPPTPPRDPVIEELLTEMKGLKDEVASIKEGRVLSGKNKTIIVSAVEAMTKAVEALQALLTSTDPAPPTEPEGPDKAVISIKPEFTDNLDLTKLAKEVAARADFKQLVKNRLRGGGANTPEEGDKPGGEE